MSVASEALKVIAALKTDMAAGIVPVATKNLAQIDAGKYLAEVSNAPAVSRFVNVWLAAQP